MDWPSVILIQTIETVRAGINNTVVQADVDRNFTEAWTDYSDMDKFLNVRAPDSDQFFLLECK
jgi:hypothetical protein